jgi:SAM-dependent methyltransferase
MGYTYYNQRTIERDSGGPHRKVAEAQRIAAFRLDPSLNDVDSLIYLHRRSILEGWLNELPSGIDVLDVGGRIQPYRSLIEPKVHTYAGLDLQFEGTVDVVATAERIPIRTESLDLVLCNDVLQYIFDPPAAMREMHRVLKPGGQLILSTRGQYPEHHDELWRFLPDGLRHLAQAFARVEVEPEGCSGSGVMTALNVLMHRKIRSPALQRITARTSVPLINVVGLAIDHMAPKDVRFTCGHSLRAFK